MKQWNLQQRGKLWKNQEYGDNWRCVWCVCMGCVWGCVYGVCVYITTARASRVDRASPLPSPLSFTFSPLLSNLLFFPTFSPFPTQGPLIGEFPFISGKAVRQQRAAEGRCRAFVFSMRVEEELVKWPEAGQRQRAWVCCHVGVLIGVAWLCCMMIVWVWVCEGCVSIHCSTYGAI